MATTGNASEDFMTDKPEDPAAQVARLRSQVDSLAVDRVTPTVTKFTADAQRTVTNAAGVVRGQLQALSRQVEQRPLISIVIATGAGVLIGRAIR